MNEWTTGHVTDASIGTCGSTHIRVRNAMRGASTRKKGARTMTIEPLLWMFAGVCFFSLGLLVGYGMCEDKQNRRKDGETDGQD